MRLLALASTMAADPLFPERSVPVETTIDIVGNYFLVAGAILILLFTALYGLGFKWWTTRAGRGVLGVFCAVTLLMVHLTLVRFGGGDYPGRDIVRLAAYTFLPVTTFYLVYGLIMNFFNGPSSITLEATDRLKHRKLPSTDPANREFQPPKPHNH
jgi:hypothetical protein